MVSTKLSDKLKEKETWIISNEHLVSFPINNDKKGLYTILNNCFIIVKHFSVVCVYY